MLAKQNKKKVGSTRLKKKTLNKRKASKYTAIEKVFWGGEEIFVLRITHSENII
jgi:hypothetical protein